MKKIVLAIDGYSACGKSTTAKAVASVLGYIYIDSGAMYRAVTLYFQEHHIGISNKKEVSRALGNINITFHNDKGFETETFLNGLNVEKEIRKMYISENVSQVSSISEVREAMVAQQRRLGKRKGVVMDGRDIGTIVFPEAELKVFMHADIYIRAGRRQQELLESDQLVDLNDIIENLQRRDHLDSTRKISPLRQADDALVLDTTFLTLEEQIDEVVNLALGKILDGNKESVNSLK